MDLTRQGNTEPANIPVRAGDPELDPNDTGLVELPFVRGTVLPGKHSAFLAYDRIGETSAPTVSPAATAAMS